MFLIYFLEPYILICKQLKMKHLLLPLIFAVGLSACNSSHNEPNTSPSDVPPSQIKQSTTVANDFFSIDVPEDWEIFSQEGPAMPAHISVSKNDGSALVTISVARSSRTIEETCKLVANNLVDDQKDITVPAKVEFGTCKVQANVDGKPVGMWMRSYPDRSLYSIYYEGEPSIVNEILMSLKGNEQIMMLLVQPL